MVENNQVIENNHRTARKSPTLLYMIVAFCDALSLLRKQNFGTLLAT